MSIFKKATFLVAAVLTFSLWTGSAHAALAENQIQAIIGLLSSFGAEQSVINNVNASLRGQTPSSTDSSNSAAVSSGCGYEKNLTRTLSEGSIGGDVASLQRFLQAQGFFTHPTITNYFGPATESAVQRWQAQHGVVSSGAAETTGYGVVGSLTRAAMIKACGGVSTPQPVTVVSSTAPSCTLSAKPYRVVSSEYTTLSWQTTNTLYAKWRGDSVAEILGLPGATVTTSQGSVDIQPGGKGGDYEAILYVYGADGRSSSCSTRIVVEAAAEHHSTLTPDTLKVVYPSSNINMSVGEKITITYAVGSGIFSDDPAIVERKIVTYPNDGGASGYIPVSVGNGTYTFDWTPGQQGAYQVLLNITHNNTTYSARSGVISVAGSLVTPSTTGGVTALSDTQVTSLLSLMSSFGAGKSMLTYAETALKGGTINGNIYGIGTLSTNQVQAIFDLLDSFGAPTSVKTEMNKLFTIS